MAKMTDKQAAALQKAREAAAAKRAQKSPTISETEKSPTILNEDRSELIAKLDKIIEIQSQILEALKSSAPAKMDLSKLVK